MATAGATAGSDAVARRAFLQHGSSSLPVAAPLSRCVWSAECGREAEVTAKRRMRLDPILAREEAEGVVDLRPERVGRRDTLREVQTLARLGLAEATGPACSFLSNDSE